MVYGAKEHKEFFKEPRVEYPDTFDPQDKPDSTLYKTGSDAQKCHDPDQNLQKNLVLVQPSSKTGSGSELCASKYGSATLQ